MSKFTLPPKPKSTITLEQYGNIHTLHCTLCKLTREWLSTDSGTFKAFNLLFIEEHKRKKCKGKK